MSDLRCIKKCFFHGRVYAPGEKVSVSKEEIQKHNAAEKKKKGSGGLKYFKTAEQYKAFKAAGAKRRSGTISTREHDAKTFKGLQEQDAQQTLTPQSAQEPQGPQPGQESQGSQPASQPLAEPTDPDKDKPPGQGGPSLLS